MNIVIITDQPVPFGMASTNRLLSLASGLSASGCDTTILIINPTEITNNIKNLALEGRYKNVLYKYLTASNVIPTQIWPKLRMYFSGIIELLKQLQQTHSKRPIDAVIMLHTWSFYPLLVYWFFIKKHGVLFLHERNEYPFLNKGKNIFRRIDFKIYMKLVLPKFDGLLLMTNFLKVYFSDHINKRCRTEIIPMTVESERFEVLKDPSSLEYIAYCGNISGNKDGVCNLIKAFSKISPKYPDLLLYIIGGSKNQDDLVKLKQLVAENKIESRVVFTGTVDRDEIPSLLINAKVLALARPSSIQAEGGFPTKLGEYLATGNPVVVTNVGEIGHYLKDGINAYLSAPDDIDEFAAKLDAALTDEMKSKTIGLKGKELAQTVFNYKVQGARIAKFIAGFNSIK